MVDIGNCAVENSDENGLTALMLASRYGLTEVVSVLIQRSDPNFQTKDGWTALMEAAAHNRLAIVQLLESSGADIAGTTSNKMTALMLAAHKGHAEIVRYLAGHETTINACNESGDTALMLAVEQKNIQIMEILLENGAAVVTHNKQGMTPLMIASKESFVEGTVLLLKFNPESQLELREDTGETALILASKQGNEEQVSLLLQNGAYGWAENHKGFTARILAMKFGHFAVESILNAWEQNNPMKQEKKFAECDVFMPVGQFLESINLCHQLEFFVESMELETVDEFRCLNQRRRDRIVKQLTPHDLSVLNSSLERLGIFVRAFLPVTSTGQEQETPAEPGSKKVNLNDVPA